MFEFTWRNGTKTVQRVDTILEVETVVERQEPSLESVPEIAHRAAEHCSTHGDCALTGAQEAEYCDRLSGCMPCVFCEPLLGVDDTCPAACDGLRETTQAPTTSAPTEAPATSEPTARPSDTNCWYGNVDIMLGPFLLVYKLCATPHAPHGAFYLVYPCMLIGCGSMLGIRCCARFMHVTVL